MSKPEDVPQRVQNIGAKMAGEYLAWLNAGNSTGSLSEHAVAAMADSFARAILAAEQREREACAAEAEKEEYGNHIAQRVARIIAAAIRNRGTENDCRAALANGDEG